MMLCNRCELLFHACRPLQGVVCPHDAAAPAILWPVEAKPVIRAAVVFDHRLDRIDIRPILIMDFYKDLL
jgi:hypothetical protein